MARLMVASGRRTGLFSRVFPGGQRIPRPCARLDGMTPVEVAARLRHLPGLAFFDSAGHLPGNWPMPVSVIAAAPTRLLRGSIHRAADRQVLRDAVAAGFTAGGDLGFPCGGLCGWVEYEGAFVFGEYPEMLVHSHADGAWWETGGLSARLAESADEPFRIGPPRSLATRAAFLAMVRRTKDWIAAGDIYQANLSQAFEAEVYGGSLFPFYLSLRDASPAPMAAWLSLDDREVLSSSPESFLRFSGRVVESRPIKGTRPRHADPDEDLRSAYELQTSSKEIAELVMITDLLRNDIGRVSAVGSVETAEMLRLESLAQVHHLVSTVRGQLRPEIDAIDALAACFPGGSITGAPKIRAMEIIRALEGRSRGIYCGAIGWFGFNEESSFNIAIRTLVRHGPHLRYQTGAGIVADSDPEMEYQETLHKAAGINRALAFAISPGHSTGRTAVF